MDELFRTYEFHEPQEKDDTFSLLIYDIIDNKKRTKFAKKMESYGKRVQKSAFEFRLDVKKLDKLISEIPNYIDDNDSVKMYRVHGNGDVLCWGNAEFETKEEIIII